MHVIKYFFSIKIIRQFRGQKKFPVGGKLPKAIPKNTIFQNPEGHEHYFFKIQGGHMPLLDTFRSAIDEDINCIHYDYHEHINHLFFVSVIIHRKLGDGYLVHLLLYLPI
jgi:hypothetical protein